MTETSSQRDVLSLTFGLVSEHVGLVSKQTVSYKPVN